MSERLVTEADLHHPVCECGHWFGKHAAVPHHHGPRLIECECRKSDEDLSLAHLDSIARREVTKALRDAAAKYLAIGRRFNQHTGEPECQCVQGDQDRPCYCDADEWLTDRATTIESGGQS